MGRMALCFGSFQASVIERVLVAFPAWAVLYGLYAASRRAFVAISGVTGPRRFYFGFWQLGTPWRWRR